MDEWKPPWAWWSHDVWMELYFYDMLFESAWTNFKRKQVLDQIEKFEKEENEPQIIIK